MPCLVLSDAGASRAPNPILLPCQSLRKFVHSLESGDDVFNCFLQQLGPLYIIIQPCPSIFHNLLLLSHSPSTTSTDDFDKKELLSSPPSANPGKARTNKTMRLPFRWNLPTTPTLLHHHSLGRKVWELTTVWAGQPKIAPPCFSFCIPSSRDLASWRCLRETEARDHDSSSAWFLPFLLRPTPDRVCVRRKSRQQQQRHMTRQLSGRVRHHWSTFALVQVIRMWTLRKYFAKHMPDQAQYDGYLPQIRTFKQYQRPNRVGTKSLYVDFKPEEL